MLKVSHHCAKANSTSPTCARRRKKSKPALKRLCVTKLMALLGVRLSKRGCMVQISRISAPNLPRPDTSPMRDSKTSSTASCRAGNELGRGPFCERKRLSQPLRTSDHNTQASRKLGATGLSSPTRLSVSTKAWCTNGSAARATAKSSNG